MTTPSSARTLPFRFLRRAVQPYALAVSLATSVSVWSVATDRAVGALLDGLPGAVIAAYCRNLTFPSDGGSRWYLPAKNELELLYRNLKPTTEPHYSATGACNNARRKKSHQRAKSAA